MLAALLVKRRWRLATAESCTGGLVAATCTALTGSSDWFHAAFVTYTLDAKIRLLGVPASTLDRYGAVSEPTARAMVEGALERSGADIAVAITGIAGPGGGDVLQPVGTVWFAWAVRHEPLISAACHRFEGDRDAVRRQAVGQAIAGLVELLGD